MKEWEKAPVNPLEYSAARANGRTSILLIIETTKNELFPLPPFLSLVLERQEGAARVMFFHLANPHQHCIAGEPE